MERQVKERLIGAAVLVAIAVILIPELLSGPTEKRKPAAAAARNERVDEQGLKTYQFDLSRPGATNGQLTTAAPPTEQTLAAAPAEQPPAEQLPAQTPKHEPVARAQTTAPPPAATPAPAPPALQTPAATPPESVAESVSAPKPAAPVRAAGASTPGWAVQLGSFADAERADRLVERLRASGHKAYLVPLRRKDGKTLQRVRIGPYTERSAAEQALQRVSGEVQGAAVVSQP